MRGFDSPVALPLLVTTSIDQFSGCLYSQFSFALVTMATQKTQKPEVVSISPLLQRLAYPDRAEIRVSAEDIASAFALIFEDQLSDIQTAALLTLLHSTGQDKQADVIAKCSHRMREAACQIEKAPLKKAVKARGIREGNYAGGLVRLSQSQSFPACSCILMF